MQRCTQRNRSALLPLVLLPLLARPDGWTQYPAVPAPPLTGSTLGQNLRNAAATTQNQATLLRTASDHWTRRAESAGYTDALFKQDFDNIQWHFQNLHIQFNWLGQFALQLGRPQANNAVAELDASLGIIAELFVFLEQQLAAGSLDRATVVRTARVFQNAIRAWEQELNRNTRRLGLVR